MYKTEVGKIFDIVYDNYALTVIKYEGDCKRELIYYTDLLQKMSFAEILDYKTRYYSNANFYGKYNTSTQILTGHYLTQRGQSIT